jgi:hypothetical protein
MSVDTEFVLACNLKDDVPEEVMYLLRFLCEGEAAVPEPPDLPAHPFFQRECWKRVLCAGSYYLPWDAGGSRLVIQEYKNITVTNPSKSLVVRCDFKNYDFEIENFLQWFAPYSKTAGFVGYFRYEEALHPTLIYFFLDGRVGLLAPTQGFQYSNRNLDTYLNYDQEHQFHYIDLNSYLAYLQEHEDDSQTPQSSGE